MAPEEDAAPVGEIAASDKPPADEPAAQAIDTPPSPTPQIETASEPAPPPETPGAQEMAAPMPDEDEGAGETCRNCGAFLVGPYCHQCGQSTDDLHRSLPRLTLEVVGSFFDLDSRFWRTIPRLFLSPAELTRDYLAGERMSQTPPLRMFLIVVVMVFLAGSIADAGRQTNYRVIGPSGVHVSLTNATPPQTPRPPPRQVAPGGDVVFEDLPEGRSGFSRWLVSSLRRALSSPDAFTEALVSWAQRLAILLLPIGALTMGAMFAFSRRYLMFDHLIFTMHGLAAQGALLSLVLVLGRFIPAAGWLLWLSPVHAFVHMRGTYRLGVLGTLFRMVGLLIGATAGGLLLGFALFLITVYEVGGR